MGWRIVYIEESDNVSSYLDNVKIKRLSDDILIPYKDIHTLIIDNYKTNLTTNFLIKCAEYKINLIICGLEHLPIALVSPIFGYSQSPLILKKQIEWNDDLKKKLHKKIIKGKIFNQIQVLDLNNKSTEVIDKLKQFMEQVLDGDITNREGLAAKIYFRELFGKNFIRFNEDIINASLNYGYTILRTQISKVLISKGLNTSLGIFHRGIDNQFNLSDDIIEVFRPIVDNYVYNNMLKKECFTREDRMNIIKLTTKNMKYNEKKNTFFNVINLYVSLILEKIDINEIEDIEMPLISNYDV